MTDKPVKSAFPHDNLERGAYHIVADPGMSLRDYFAAQAVNGILARMGYIENKTHLTQQAYEIADAMMAEREKS